MSLIEKRTLKQVTVLAEQNAVNVQWADQIIREGVVISEQYHRKAYTAAQKDDFLLEVAGAEAYLGILNW